MSKFTPGKWHCDELPRNIDGTILVITPEDIIAYVVGCKNDEANARLIAAAPEMYELLQTLAHREYDNTVTAIISLEAEKLLARIDGEETRV